MGERILDRLAAAEVGEDLAERLGLVPGRIDLIRAWPRGDDRLVLEYGDSTGMRVVGQWCADTDTLEGIAKETALVADGNAVALIGDARARVLLQAGGVDRRLPPLATLVRKRGASLVSHRPERRGVVWLPADAGGTYVKVLPPAGAEAALRAHCLMASIAGQSFAVPEVAAHDLAQGVIQLHAVAGTPLHALLPTTRGTQAAAFVGFALRALQRPIPPAELSAHGPAAEAATLRRWLLRLRPYAPELAVELEDLVTAVERDLGGAPPGPFTTLHRDLHDKQLLVTESGDVALIDLEGLACGEAALDLANLLTHLELRAVQGDCTVETAELAAAALVDAANPPQTVLRRLSAYAQSARLRLACVYALRPRARDVARRLIEKAAQRRRALPLGI